jgi:hypothetical protein
MITNADFNAYILNYIKNDKTKSAVMLSGSWGTGKSYYIINSLIPFLKLEENGSIECLCVSLYGINDLREINKSLYFENKILHKKTKRKLPGWIKAYAKPVFTGAIGIGKTILKSLTSVDLDLSIDNPNMQKLYDSVDLKNKLVVFEDIERSGIDIIEFMGYVNNLCEQDGIKVLLVANEKEIIKKELNKKKNEYLVKGLKFYEEQEDNEIIISSSIPTEYKNIKEKTVSDTILFYSSCKEAMSNILSQFNNDYLNKIINYDKDIFEKIEMEIMRDEKVNSQNLRSFIYACQKTSEIFKQVEFDMDLEFAKHIFLSNIAFVLKKKSDESKNWDNDGLVSSELGTYKYPIYKFSYDYICNQYLNINQIQKLHNGYVKNKKDLATKKELEPYFKIIYSYYICSEDEIKDAVDKIRDFLKTKDTIPVAEYGRLANYLISIKRDISYNEVVEECKKLMINNISKTDNKSIDRIVIHSGISLETQDDENELNLFIEELNNKIKNKNNELKYFDYSIENLDYFCEYIRENKDSFIIERSFAKQLNNDKIINLIKQCTAEQMQKLRSVFHYVYSFSNIGEYYSNDKESLIDLQEKVNALLNKEKAFDKIQIKQLRYFYNNLKDFIERL